MLCVHRLFLKESITCKREAWPPPHDIEGTHASEMHTLHMHRDGRTSGIARHVTAQGRQRIATGLRHHPRCRSPRQQREWTTSQEACLLTGARFEPSFVYAWRHDCVACDAPSSGDVAMRERAVECEALLPTEHPVLVQSASARPSSCQACAPFSRRL